MMMSAHAVLGRAYLPSLSWGSCYQLVSVNSNAVCISRPRHESKQCFQICAGLNKIVFHCKMLESEKFLSVEYIGEYTPPGTREYTPPGTREYTPPGTREYTPPGTREYREGIWQIYTPAKSVRLRNVILDYLTWDSKVDGMNPSREFFLITKFTSKQISRRK